MNCLSFISHNRNFFAQMNVYSVAEPVVATNAEEEETAEETTELDTTAYDFVGNITADLVELSETTSLKISSDPEGATILVNRRISGTTPFYAEEIEAGEYNIMLLKEGFALFDTTITLSTGQHLQFTKSLSPENQQAQPAQARAAQNRNEADQADTAATISDEELAQKRRRMDKIGIIVFLSVMFISMTMQEARNR
jgi:hypothetical protein